MQEMLNQAMNYLSSRNLSIKELTRLLEKDYAHIDEVDSKIKQTINRLQELNLINDNHIAFSMAERYLNKGDRYIRQRLVQKGITKEAIDKAIEELPLEFERAMAEACKKLPSIKESDAKARDNKLLRFLSNRGFSASVCYDVLDMTKQAS